MDTFRCLCGKAFSTNYSLRRHSEKCQISKDINQISIDLINTATATEYTTEDEPDEIQKILDELTEKQDTNKNIEHEMPTLYYKR